ncbi:putative bifunctional diguanylate cyclase/phosphodiesterase [Pseudoduganella lutea]|uniref:Sensor domain-containing phosphodiesterase n=1 Tax=Pseudoduganella lutea TaxID=321985 RepID=A0A4V0Z314_9BURK|nr:sensor domain-containing phosphodiesterase [Pseudoduganella lutea]QBE61853.1 sensor domain-containing phosphodiesterase [Pseudoduganella lutea]
MRDFARPPQPDDEEDRLKALQAAQLLDTQPEEVFDRITRMACSALGVPVSLISLVDRDRQWFKSSCGLEARETGRDVSFCGHAILSDAPFIVDDAGMDPRFAANPLVTGAPGIRFYAGIPIHAGPSRIGTLCVIDTAPRTLGSRDITLLKSLARTVEDLLYVRQATLESVQSLNDWMEHYGDKSRSRVQALRNLVLRDRLTGLPSRVAIDSAIGDAVKDGKHHEGAGLLAVVDIDNLSAVNERFGHDVGDGLIGLTAERLLQVSEKTDIAARIGGGMFAFLLRGAPDHRAAVARLAGIHELLNRSFVGSHGIIQCSLTTGYVPLGQQDGGAEALLDTAHEAVRQAKALGHGLMSAYNRSLGRLGQRALEHDLRAAISTDQLFLVYQPKVDFDTRALVGCEALLRWQHPSLGLIAPCDFIPVAEESGVIVQLGRWTLDEACRQIRQWLDAGKDGPGVAVNLSPRQFLHGDIVETVRTSLAAHGVPGNLLELELTESVAVCDVDRVIAIMHELKRLHVSLSIDDFGTGFSSLSYLMRLPVDTLKIDRSFICDLVTDQRAQALVKGVIDICDGLGMNVIAEGVETAAQASLLSVLGCSTMQGYLFGRPMSPDQFEDALQAVSD